MEQTTTLDESLKICIVAWKATWFIDNTAPKNFPEGFYRLKGGGPFFKMDDSEHVTEVRDIFGYDITSDFVDPNEVKISLTPRTKRTPRPYSLQLRTLFQGNEGYYIQIKNNKTKEESWVEITKDEWDWIWSGGSRYYKEIGKRLYKMARKHGYDIGEYPE